MDKIIQTSLWCSEPVLPGGGAVVLCEFLNTQEAYRYLTGCYSNGLCHVNRVRPVGSTSDTDALDLDRMKQVRSSNSSTG